MTDREEIIDRLPRVAVKVLRGIEFTLNGQQSVTLSYDRIADDFHVGRAGVRYALKVLELTGLVSIGQGPFRISKLSLSRKWETLSPNDVARLLPRARLPRSPRGRQKSATSKPRRYVRKEAPRDAEISEPPPQYKVPGLPHVKWLDGWEG